MALIVSYTPINKESVNVHLLARIRQFNRWAILNDYTYIVDNMEIDTLTTRDVMPVLKEACTPGDRLSIFHVSRPCATMGETEFNSWIRRNMPSAEHN